MAMIIYNQRYKGRLAQVVPAAKAREIESFLNNPPDDITDEQAEFLSAIKNIYHGKRTEPQQPDTSHLYHTGVQQGMNEALPVGDR